MRTLTDPIGRSFNVLRVSLLDRCNFACTYCVCEDELNTTTPKSAVLSSDELIDLIGRLHHLLHLQTIRLTGGEPLLYPDLTKLTKGIRQLGIQDIRMTTNGFLLAKKVVALQQAGLRSINVSLDALSESSFYKVTKRTGLQQVVEGIIAAKEIGLEVKINTVIMAGENDQEILPLLNFAFRHRIKIRFLELMGMGHLFGDTDSKFFSRQAILDRISSVYEIHEQVKKCGDTATYWRTSCGHSFGIIANESQPFCADCNRLRLDCQGNIYGCLSSNTPIPLRAVNSQQGLEAGLHAALGQKQMRFSGSEMSMLTIGG
ncbi:GTP 3',8-cyclase MoaA [Sphingobacterium litopenaei]|uniref:GTP 3',8-cyclase MoaA n=1 Tax=Sphingobacterium litopenaei TaxID=2763500 RepID=A0ABR7YDC3_9SPHI|nr:GTP 3',8-cyclase MoaA [Sphingobacterium litopenaei]MBD1429208.1 GTP 3',8-cyclase MoaA [Sphingobacterium litopenaei]